MLNRMQAEGVIDLYAIGGAVGATFYLEPLATVDVDVFVNLQPEPGKHLIDPLPIFRYLSQRGCQMEGEYVLIGGWPVQFLAPTGPLVQDALEDAVTIDVEGTPTRVFSAEHLAAICLETGRAKDKARLLQFLESSSLDILRFKALVSRHGLDESWKEFHRQFLKEGS
jgi:hypothetical protein